MLNVLPLRITSVADVDRLPDPPPLLVDAAGLAGLLSLGVRTVRAHDAAGKLPAPVRIGGRVLWRVDEIRAWLAAGAPHRDEWASRQSARK